MDYTKRFGEDLLNSSMKTFESLKRNWGEIDEKMVAKVEADFQKYIHACKEVFGKRDDLSLREMMEEIKERLPQNLWLQIMIHLKTMKFLVAGRKSIDMAPKIMERIQILKNNNGKYTVH